MLESQARERTRSAAEEGPGNGTRDAVRDPVRADTNGGAQASRAVREGVPPHASQGGGDPGEGLGADGRVLRLSEGALEAPADHERGREPLRGSATAH